MERSRYNENICCPLCGTKDGPEHRMSCREVEKHLNEEELKWWSKTSWLADKDKPRYFLNLSGIGYDHAKDSDLKLYDCIRYRGLVPAHMSFKLLSSSSDQHLVLGRPGPEHWKWATDGSKQTPKQSGSPSVVCVAGSGGASLQWDKGQLQSAVGFIANVPGRQTVPRAEVHAVNNALKISGVSAHMMHIDADATYVTKGQYGAGNPKNEHLHSGPNDDLWATFRQLRGSEATIAKVKAHEGIPADDAGDDHFQRWIANAVADVLAKVAVKHFCVDPLVAEFLRKIVTVAYLSLLRLTLSEFVSRNAFQNMGTWELQEGLQSLNVRSCTFDCAEKLAVSRHELVKVGTVKQRIRCVRCGYSTPASQLRLWNEIECGNRMPTSMKGREATACHSILIKTTGGSHIAVKRSNGRLQCLKCHIRACAYELRQQPCVLAAQPEEQEMLPAEVKGSFQDFNASRRKRADSNRITLRTNKIANKCATAACLHSINFSPDVKHSSDAGSQPVWASEVHKTHDAFFGAGVVYCRRCSSTATSSHCAARLLRVCDALREGWHFPEGSKSRLARLRKGMHPNRKSLSWPDGRPTATRTWFRRLQREREQPSEPKGYQDEFYKKRAAEEAVLEFRWANTTVLRPTVQAELCAAMNNITSTFIASGGQNFDTGLLRAIDATPFQVVTGIETWLRSDDYEQLIEELLELTSPFETAIFEFTQGLRGLHPPRSRFRKKGKTSP